MDIELDTVYNCDCMELMEEMRRGGITANLLLTDIPYNTVNKHISNGKRQLNKGNADIITFDLHEFLAVADDITTDNFVIFCGFEQISEITLFFKEKGYLTRLLIWEKRNPTPLNGEFGYLSGIEPAVYARKPKGTFNAFCKNTVFRHKSGENSIHPTMKPLSLWYELLNDLTNKGDVVLDTCMGSFTTAVACNKLQRHFIGAELDKDYFEKGLTRLQKEQAQPSIFDIIKNS